MRCCFNAGYLDGGHSLPDSEHMEKVGGNWSQGLCSVHSIIHTGLLVFSLLLYCQFQEVMNDWKGSGWDMSAQSKLDPSGGMAVVVPKRSGHPEAAGQGRHLNPPH